MEANKAKSKNKKVVIAVVVIIVIAAVVCGILFAQENDTAGTGSAVGTLPLSKANIEQIVTANGTVQSIDSRAVTAGAAAGKIAAVYVSEGQSVSLGDTLCLMDTALLDINIAAAQKSLADANAQFAESLAQGVKREADAYQKYIDDEAQLNTAVDEAKAAFDKANAESKSIQKKLTASQTELLTVQQQIQILLTTDPTNPTLASLLAQETALKVQIDALQKQLEGISALQAAYNGQVSARDQTLDAEWNAYTAARDAVISQRLMDPAPQIQAQLNTLNEQKAEAQIKAPIDGTVTAVSAKADGYPAMDKPLFVIENISVLEVSALVPEYDASLLKAGLNVNIVTDAILGGEWTGVVKSISSVATDQSNNFTVVISVTSPLDALKSGMSAKLNIVTDSQADVFAVPYSSLSEDESGNTVIYILDESAVPAEGQAQARIAIPVATGLETDYLVEISGDGLKEGLLVLTDPDGLTTDTPIVLPDMGA
ncbi:MAG: efflux RND transporter periplasmic adaptor subunit [Clostridiales Family XIII bacterium]|nr:efflux RND transporter periplasmic adaptor subunit [Clostridiales Family XIII bacterium]